MNPGAANRLVVTSQPGYNDVSLKQEVIFRKLLKVHKSFYRKSCYSDLMHRIIDTFEYSKHALESLLKFLSARSRIAEFEQVFEQ